MNRSEHLQWCKDRAYEYCDKMDSVGAVGSFISDMRKHPDTINHSALTLMVSLMAIGEFNDIDNLRKFINGFN